MIAKLRALALDEDGTAIIEYALVLTLVSMVSYVVLVGLGDSLKTFFDNSSAGLANVAKNPQ